MRSAQRWLAEAEGVVEREAGKSCLPIGLGVVIADIPNGVAAFLRHVGHGGGGSGGRVRWSLAAGSQSLALQRRLLLWKERWGTGLVRLRRS